MTAQGEAKASLSSLGATLGCEVPPFRFVSVDSSPEGTTVIASVTFAPIHAALALPFRAATLWLIPIHSMYPGRRQRSLRSRFLALGFDRAVASRLAFRQPFVCREPQPGPSWGQALGRHPVSSIQPGVRPQGKEICGVPAGSRESGSHDQDTLAVTFCCYGTYASILKYSSRYLRCRSGRQSRSGSINTLRGARTTTSFQLVDALV